MEIPPCGHVCVCLFCVCAICCFLYLKTDVPHAESYTLQLKRDFNTAV